MELIASLSPFRDDHGKALALLKSLGFSKIDLILIENWGIVTPSQLAEDLESHTRRVCALLDEHGLEAVSINAGFPPQLHERGSEADNAARRDKVRATCRFMKAMGIQIGAHYPGHIGDWKNDPEGVWRDTITSLREIQQIAKEEGVTLAPELHFNTPFEAPEDARKLIREIPGLPYTYEPSHFIVRGIDAQRETADLLAGARHCHFRTSAPGKIQAAPPEGLDTLDWMMESLAARAFAGYVSIEYLPKGDFSIPSAIQTLRARYLKYFE